MDKSANPIGVGVELFEQHSVGQLLPVFQIFAGLQIKGDGLANG